jgi:REP element-mobilizing transposase RayT
MRVEIGKILRELCNWKQVEIVEAEVCPDHIHMLVKIPPKMSVSGFSQRKKHLADFRAACKPEVQIWESDFLVQRLFRRHSREE